MVEPVVGQERVGQVPGELELIQLPPALQVCRPLGVEELLGGAPQHECQDYLGEEGRLEVRLGRDRLLQPGVDVSLAGFGDDVALAIGTGTGLDLSGNHFAVTHQPGQSGVDLAKWERLGPAKMRVVVAFEVVTVAWLSFEQPKEGIGNAHATEPTLSAYSTSIPAPPTLRHAPSGRTGGTTARVPIRESTDGAVIRRRIRGSGLDLALNERGDASGPTVILVHGFPDTSAAWEPVARLLSTTFHVVAYDVRGAGGSDAPQKRADYALALLVEDMAAVIDAVSPDEPIHLVAHDWGSIQGWEAVTSDLLAGRIASYTSISGPPLDHAALWARRHRAGNLADLARALRQGLRSWYIALFHLPFLPEIVTQVARAQRMLAATLRQQGRPQKASSPTTRSDDFAHGLQLYRANVLQRFRHPVAGHTETPVQIIVPLKDRYISPELLDGLETWSSVVWRRYVPAGHWIIRTHPTEIAEWVRHVVAFVRDGHEAESLAQARIAPSGTGSGATR